MPRSSKVLLVCLTLVVMAAACGDGESDEVGSAAGDDTAAVDEQPGSDDTEDSEAMSGDGDSEWCDAIRTAADEAGSPLDLDLLGLSPDEVEARLKGNLDELERWEARAPAEIESQVTTLVDGYRTFLSIGDEAEWDLTAMATDPDFQAAFQNTDLIDAAAEVDAYSRDVCGVDLALDPTNTGGTAVVPDGGDAGDIATAFLEQFGLPPNFLTDEQLTCVNEQLAAAFPDGVPENLTLTPDNIEIFDAAGAACGIGNG